MTYTAWRRQHAYGESVALRHLIGRRYQPVNTDALYHDWCIHERQTRAAESKRNAA